MPTPGCDAGSVAHGFTMVMLAMSVISPIVGIVAQIAAYFIIQNIVRLYRHAKSTYNANPNTPTV